MRKDLSKSNDLNITPKVMRYAVEPSLIPKIKSEYIQGHGSVREICDKYLVGETRAIEVRASKEKWTQLREKHLNQVCEKSTEIALSEAQEWQKMVINRSKKDWKFIDKSIDLLCAEDSTGNPLSGIDPDAIAGYYRARKLMDDMARRAMGLSDVNLDIKSGGKSLSESMADALEKLHALKSQDSKPLSPQEIDLVVNCEIIKEENP